MSAPRVVIIGGGPGGYEAALVAAQFGAQVTVVEEHGPGGSCVLSDCVPSKTLIATSNLMAALDGTAALGISARPDDAHADAERVNARIRDLALAQSADIGDRLAAAGVAVVPGRGTLVGPGRVAVGDREFTAQTVL